jgi:hypothetical protein
MAIETRVGTNGAAELIDIQRPYEVTVRIRGVSPMFFHAWNNEAVAEKAKSAKGSKAKKSDNLESFVYRDEGGLICLPGEYLKQSMVNAAKFRQDPRSPRKSAMDLYKAGIVALTELAPVKSDDKPKGTKDWDYVDARRAVVQRAAITRERPAFRIGWYAEVTLAVLLPEYISYESFLETLNMAGRLIGVADQRPSYGRFQVVYSEVRQV